jgi:hypothetical protein
MDGEMRGKTLLTAGIALAAVGLAACGNSGVDSTPDACLGGATVFREALESAPNDVRLADSDTKISDCLVEGQSGGELATTGEAMVRAASQLNRAARQDPGSPAAFQLGYLIGAANRGAEDTSGIHTDLLRRLSTAAQFASGGNDPAPEFGKPYAEGLGAGRASG